MKYKKIITSGCSFSDAFTPFSWPNQLELYIKKINSSVVFDHRGLASQGQELIQKKASHAIYEAISTGYKSDDIAVFVMWSSPTRKSFYIDNTDIVDEIVNNWKNSVQGWQLQFADLKNQTENICTIQTRPPESKAINYNKNGGWYITSAQVIDELEFIKKYFMIGKNNVSLQMVHETLEQIIFLQNFCKLNGIKLYQQWYMDYTKEDIENYKDHQIIKYLYSQLDHNTFISQESIYNYLKDNPECFKSPDDLHPNGLGHRRWLMEVIVPYLEDDNFFD